MIVLSHRGLDRERAEHLRENSLASFRWAMTRGFGVELDLQLTADSELIVTHDLTSERWSQGKTVRPWSALARADFSAFEGECGALCTMPEALALVSEFPSVTMAIHVKGQNQSVVFIKALAKALMPFHQFFSRLLVFDLKVAPAGLLRKACPGIGLAPSVAHVFDVQRCQSVAQGTLYSPLEILSHEGPYNWVWLDEWDRRAVDGKSKALYEETTETFLSHGFNVALISPELHKGEKHQDAENLQVLEKRWREILKLKVNAICTDYPARFSGLANAG